MVKNCARQTTKHIQESCMVPKISMPTSRLANHFKLDQVKSFKNGRWGQTELKDFRKSNK